MVAPCGTGLLHVPASPGAPSHGMAHLVPQMESLGGKPSGARLTRAQQSELEMARRRAQKAAQGKAANTASARRAKRRATDGEAASDDELQQKLAGVTDEKEAKRLKRWALKPCRLHNSMPQHSFECTADPVAEARNRCAQHECSMLQVVAQPRVGAAGQGAQEVIRRHPGGEVQGAGAAACRGRAAHQNAGA